MRIASIGIDLGKNTFHLVALGERNQVLVRKKFSRSQLFTYTANLPSSLIGLEACAGAHFVGGTLREQGHQVRLIPAQFVKPYRKSNKNDFLDAEAIAEAVTKQNMRFALLKTRSSWTGRPCTACAIDSCRVGLHSSTRFADSCWNVASPLRPSLSTCARTCPP